MDIQNTNYICVCVYAYVYMFVCILLQKNTVMNNLVDIFAYNYNYIFKKFCLAFMLKIFS